MARNVTLLIADDEPLICGMLQKLTDFDGLGLSLLGCVNDGESLEREILSKKPDIVLTDISMPRKDGLQVIQAIREKDIPCRFLIISGYRQFEYAYNALKYNVEDYLLKPVDKGELNRALKKLCEEIRAETYHGDSIDQEKLRQDFIDHGIHKGLRQQTLSLDDLNESYYTNFKSGCFRVAMLKLGFSREPERETEDVSSVVQKLDKLVKEVISPRCFEVLSSSRYDGIMFLMNYAPDTEREIKKHLATLYEDACQFVDMFEGLNLTLCVGKAVDDPYQMEEAKNSCRRAIWMRHYYGINQILYEESEVDVKDPGCKIILDKVHMDMENAIIGLSEEQMTNAIHRFFDQPKKILCSTMCMQFLRDEIGLFSERYAGLIKRPAEAQDIKSAIHARIYRESTFTGYETQLIEVLGIYLKKLIAVVKEKKAKPVLMAIAYIEQHYAEPLSLETMAQHVNLSPIYFSNLFKKETGKNFSDYLTEYRIKKAKELLRDTGKNINEISDDLGYSDARYFSKVFKKATGVKPTDYRRLYN